MRVFLLRDAEHLFPDGSPSRRLDPVLAHLSTRVRRTGCVPSLARDPPGDADACRADRAGEIRAAEGVRPGFRGWRGVLPRPAPGAASPLSAPAAQRRARRAINDRTSPSATPSARARTT